MNEEQQLELRNVIAALRQDRVVNGALWNEFKDLVTIATIEAYRAGQIPVKPNR